VHQDWSSVRRLITIEDHSDRWPLTPIGNDWSREYYGGSFYVFDAPPVHPAVSLVFVQSRDGNTNADNPSELGGGPTDLHLLYQGLTRVAADGVLAGAASVGRNVFFTIHHPELVALRLALGYPRHPAQMVLSNHGRIDLSARLFSTPAVRVILLAGPECERVIGPQLRDRAWITMVAIGDSLRDAFNRLRRDHGITRISAVGGRTAATALIDAGLVQDLYLTTTAIDGGQPDTPWYAGRRPPRLAAIVRKREDAAVNPILFEHLALSPAERRA
jgi:riboflavin biosynthesis pyrimidine reductase